jgi:Tfp pilus assembly protein PilV
MSCYKKSHTKGFSIVEIVVGAAIVVTIVSGVAAAWQAYLKMSNTAARNAQSALLTQEAGEALRTMRDISWNTNIYPMWNTAGTPYQLYWTGTQYQATTSDIVLQNQFIRTIVFATVNRDAITANISTTSGVIDNKTAQVAITIYPSSATTSPIMQSFMLLHNIYGN